MTAEPSSLPPMVSIETEQGLIGMVLMRPASLDDCRDLRPEHFFEPTHAAIWQRILEFSERGERIDALLVAASFRDDSTDDGMTVRQYVGRMVAEAPAITGARTYAEFIKQAWALRALSSVGADVADQWGGTLPQLLLNDAFDRIEAIRAGLIEAATSRPRPVGDISAEVAIAAQDRATGKAPRAPSTGIPDLDAKLPMRGLAAGSLLVVAGRTGMGKSMFLSSLARQAARQSGVAFFALEVGAEEMSARMLADLIGDGPTYEEILSGSLTDTQLEAVHVASRDLQHLPIQIDPRPSLTMGDIERSSANFAASIAKRGIPLGLIVIDHAQIVRASSRYQGNRVGELGEIANQAKVLAKRLGCTVALASQVNRATEQRDDKRPTMADLRASGEIEEAADCIGLLYRPAYYVERSAEFKEGDPLALDEFAKVRNSLELAIDKSRQGRTGTVNLWCDPGRSSVRCLAHTEQRMGGAP